jgi:hypothetical protein
MRESRPPFPDNAGENPRPSAGRQAPGKAGKFYNYLISNVINEQGEFNDFDSGSQKKAKRRN